MLAPTFLAWIICETWSGRARVIASALSLGVAIWFKPVPLLLLRGLLPRLEGWRDRVLYGALAMAPALVGTLPYLLLWPDDVAKSFLGYSSWFGQGATR
jgi:uncharacterized membrane protein